MDAEEKEIDRHMLNNVRSLEFYYRHKEQILEKRRTDRIYKARQCRYQQAYYQKRKAMKQKQVKPVQIQTEQLQTQQEPSFTLSFT